MKKTIGGRQLLSKAKREAKRQDNRRIKRLVKRHAKRLVSTSGSSPVLTSEKPALEPTNQK